MRLRSRFKKLLATAFLLVFVSPLSAEAFLYRAASKRATQSILSKGIDPAKFRGGARFGKGFYAAGRPSTAVAEKGKRSSVVRYREGRYLKKNTWDLRRPDTKRFQSLLGKKVDLRGAFKKGVIGPKLGRRLGRIAGREGKVIQYRSARTGGSNFFIPKRLFKEKPNIVQTDKPVR